MLCYIKFSDTLIVNKYFATIYSDIKYYTTTTTSTTTSTTTTTTTTTNTTTTTTTTNNNNNSILYSAIFNRNCSKALNI